MACKKLEYDGIAYYSKRVADEAFARSAINLVLFVDYENEDKGIARHMKIDNITGSIKLGNNADFAVVDKDLNVYMTIVNGQIVYKK